MRQRDEEKAQLRANRVEQDRLAVRNKTEVAVARQNMMLELEERILPLRLRQLGEVSITRARFR